MSEKRMYREQMMNGVSVKSDEKPESMKESSYTGKNTASVREKTRMLHIVFYPTVCLGCLIALFIVREEKTFAVKLMAGGAILFLAIWLADTVYEHRRYANVTLRHVQWVTPQIGDKCSGSIYSTAGYSLKFTVNVNGATKEVQTGYIFKKGRIYPKCLRTDEVVGKPQRAGYDANKDCWIII